MLRQRELLPREGSPTQPNTTSHSDASYEALAEWYKQCRSNYFQVDTSNLKEMYNTKHACYRLGLSYLLYSKSELNQLVDGEY
jgi:hypothetical protein